MTPQSVGVPHTNFVLGKHSGRHALGLRCEELGFPLERHELDQLYRHFLELADRMKTVGDDHILELIPKLDRKALHASAAGESHRTVFNSGGAAAPSVVLGRGEHENDQQEDYLWGV